MRFFSLFSRIGFSNTYLIGPDAGGDAILIPAGTLHALGPGLVLYEIQEASDTTYRVYDWGRPASVGRRRG